MSYTALPQCVLLLQPLTGMFQPLSKTCLFNLAARLGAHHTQRASCYQNNSNIIISAINAYTIKINNITSWSRQIDINIGCVYWTVQSWNRREMSMAHHIQSKLPWCHRQRESANAGHAINNLLFSRPTFVNSWRHWLRQILKRHRWVFSQ